MRPGIRLLALVGVLTGAALLLLLGQRLGWPVAGAPQTGLMAACLIVLTAALWDAYQAFRLPEAQIERRLPAHFSVGKTHTIVLLVNWRGRRNQVAEVYDGHPGQWRADKLDALQLRPNRIAHVDYAVRPSMRGDAMFSGCQYALKSPFGLWWRVRRIALPDTVRVLPDFSQILGADALGLTHWLSLVGARALPRAGEGQEFRQLREFVDGDSIRHVDWKATARLKKPMVRAFTDDQDRQVVMVLDCGPRMRTVSADGLTHFDHVLKALLLTAYTALKHEDSVGLMTTSPVRYLPPRKGLAQLGQMVRLVYDLQPTLPADDEEVARQLQRHLKRRALVMVLSHLDEGEAARRSLIFSKLQRRHRLVFVGLRQEDENRLQHAPVRNRRDSFRYVGLQTEILRQQALLKNWRQLRIDTLLSLPQALGAALINHYLALKRQGNW